MKRFLLWVVGVILGVAVLLGEIPWLAENPENAATGKYINLALM